ncbi:hypothetical protein Tco_0138270, partial [Tanacetum coccineum]
TCPGTHIRAIQFGCFKVDLEEFDLKSALFNEDAMDKEVADKVKDHKRKHDSDDDEDDGMMMKPSAGQTGWESEASASKQHPALSSTGWQITDTREAGVDSSMHRSDPSGTLKNSLDDITMQDEGNDSDMEDTDNAHIPKVSTTKWFKPIPESERPATPKPEWTIPPNDSRNQNITGQMHTPQRLKFRRKTSFKGRRMILGRSSNGSATQEEEALQSDLKDQHSNIG